MTILHDMKLLSSRRAYEFRADDLRLTVLSIPKVMEQIKRVFDFHVAVQATPLPTFGPVPQTIPPGLVFNAGAWVSPEDQVFPIRLLHVEQRRIVIDVAGPSSALEPIFDVLRAINEVVKAPDGTPPIGEPQRVLDYSEMSIRAPFRLEAAFDREVTELLAKTLVQHPEQPMAVLVPALSVQLHPSDEEFPGLNAQGGRLLQLTIRAGTNPEEHVYFSAAPLDSERHQIFLKMLAALIAE